MAKDSVRYCAGLARRVAALLTMGLFLSAGAAQVGGAVDPAQERSRMWMTVGAKRFAVTLEDNPTVRELKSMLPVTFDMTELNGNEKLFRLPRSMPTNEMRPGTVRTGDVLLYGKDTLVVFYKTFPSSYSYTRIGRIDNPTGLAEALGPGNPRVAFSMP